MNGEPENNELVDPSHLEAAREFFNENAEPGKPQEPSTEEPATETKSLLGDALGTKSEAKKRKLLKSKKSSKLHPKRVNTDPSGTNSRRPTPTPRRGSRNSSPKVKATGEPEAVETLRARVKELEEQNNQFSSRLKDVDFKSHPEYFEKFEKPVMAAKESMKELAEMESADVNSDALFANERPSVC